MAEGFSEEDSGAASQGVGGLPGLLAAIVVSRRTGLDLREAAGELIAEHARLNRWILDHKAEFSAAEHWNLSALTQKLGLECRAAWDAFLAEPRGEGAAGDYRKLGELLRDTKRVFEEVRTTGVVAYKDPEMPDEILDL